MKLAILAILLGFTFGIAHASPCKKGPIKIAVIDTGFGFNNQGHDAHLCKFGHKDLTVDMQTTKDYATKTPIPVDKHGHGTNIVGLIEENLKDSGVDYCIVVLKYYSTMQTGRENAEASARAFRYANNIHVDFINFSGGGSEVSYDEKKAVLDFLDGGGQLIAAAGNEGRELKEPTLGSEFLDDGVTETYYPAMTDNRIIVVGNECKNNVRCKSSNYGSRVNRWEIGEEVTAYGITMTGTSQATAVATGKIVAATKNTCFIGYKWRRKK